MKMIDEDMRKEIKFLRYLQKNAGVILLMLILINLFALLFVIFYMVYLL